MDTTGPIWEDLQNYVRKLPAYPFPPDSDTVLGQYKESLNSCATPRDLQAHTAKWAPLWAINLRFPGETLEHEQALTSGLYDPEKVWEHLVFLKTGVDPGEALWTDIQLQIASDVLMPRLLVELVIYGKYFGVPTNAVLIQSANLTELF